MVSAAFERLVAAIESAKQVPLTGQIRVNSEELLRMIDSARAERPQATGQFEPIEELIATGRPIPLTEEVRIDRQRALSLLKEARKAVQTSLQFLPEGS